MLLLALFMRAILDILQFVLLFLFWWLIDLVFAEIQSLGCWLETDERDLDMSAAG